MNNVIEKKKKDRFLYLSKLYEMVNGRTDTFEEDQVVGKALGFSTEQTDEVIDYLIAKGLAAYMTMGGMIGLTLRGLQEVEQSYANPSQGTTHFPPINIINVQNMNNSQIQQGSIDSNQTMTNNSHAELTNLIEDLVNKIKQSELDEDKKDITEVCSQVILSQSQLPEASRDKKLITNSWEKLSRIANLIAVGDIVVKASPFVLALLK